MRDLFPSHTQRLRREILNIRILLWDFLFAMRSNTATLKGDPSGRGGSKINPNASSRFGTGSFHIFNKPIIAGIDEISCCMFLILGCPDTLHSHAKTPPHLCSLGLCYAKPLSGLQKRRKHQERYPPKLNLPAAGKEGAGSRGIPKT
jgi:hypothetical protein